MDGTESGNIWQNSRKLHSVLHVSPYSYHLSCISHETNSFQKCVDQGRDISHFIDLFFLGGLKVLAFKKIIFEANTFILLAGTSFIWKYLRKTWDGMHIITEDGRGNGLGGGEEKGNACQEQTLDFLPFLFPEIRVAEKWLAGAGAGGRGRRADSSLRGSPSYKFELLPQSGSIFMPEERWHSPHNLQLSYYILVDCTSKSLPTLPYVKISFLKLPFP